jgi:zona occludens toxin
MLVLVTGLPGNGKTLYTINWVKAKAEKEGRTVYYSGIADLKLPWVEFDFKKWPELPPNSIIVVDEAQRELRPRMHGAAVPEYVAALETHRHKGVDIVLITQHPMLIDANARRLVGLHFHLVRKFGTQASTVHEWASVKEACDKSRDDSTRHDFVFPKAAFAWYKSAEVHTHKARIPFRVWVLIAVPILLLGAAYAGFRWFSKKVAPDKAPVPAVMAKGGAPGAAAPGAAPAVALTPAQYVDAHLPRVRGLAYTAPVYDSVTAPVVAPYPAACGTLTRYRDGEPVKDCRCFTQQATRLEMPDDLCQRIVERGFFVAWQQGPQNVPQEPSTPGTVPEAHRHALAPPGSIPGASLAGLTPRPPVPQLPTIRPDGSAVIPAGDGGSPLPRSLPQ